MYYIVETQKSFQQAAEDLDTAVKRHGFGVLHIHDLGETLRSKGIVFDEQCKIFEVCNPGQAAKVLSPTCDSTWRCLAVSRYLQIKARPKLVLSGRCKCCRRYLRMKCCLKTATEVEEKTIQMIDDAK